MQRSLLWDPYVFIGDEDFQKFWGNHLEKSEKVCFILGKSFDQRMLKGIEAFSSSSKNWQGHCEVIMIDFDDDPGSRSSNKLNMINVNVEKLENLLKLEGWESREKKIKMWDGKGFEKHRVGHSEIPKQFSQEIFNKYSDIIVDVSTLPKSIYFTLVNLLYSKTQRPNDKPVNFHIINTEDTLLDTYMHRTGIEEEPYILPGYISGNETEEESLVVWIPLLGTEEEKRLERIYDKIKPTEICPVLPSPSVQPKRSEELLVEYRYLLFDSWDVESKNIVYASELNPFDVYRQIVKIAQQYRESLSLIGECKIIISALSNNLMSLGALMAAYDLKNFNGGIKISVVHVDCLSYTLDPEYQSASTNEQKIYSLWIGGNPYNARS